MKRISVNDIKTQLKKSQKVMLIVTVLCSVNTLIWTKGFFADGDYLDANSFYQIALMLLMCTSLFVMTCLIPIHIKTNPDNVEEQQVGIVTRILALWLSVCFNLAAQSVIYGILSVISPSFTFGLFDIVLCLIGISLLALVWVIFCTFIYLLAKGSIAWYVTGFLTANIAPMIIIYACTNIFNKNNLRGVYNDYNSLAANPFVAVVRILELQESLWVIGAILVIALLVVLIYKFAYKEKLISIINSGYKFVIAVLISLSLGFMVYGVSYNVQSSLPKILIAIIVAALTGGIISLFTFGKQQWLKLCAVVLTVALLLGGAFVGLPILSHANEYYLPDADDIESITFSLQYGDTIEITDNFEEILSVNSDIIELFKKGCLPQDIDSFPTRDCLANCWQELCIDYTLKNGKRIHREYRDLIAPEFDDVFIKLAQSEAYLSSMRNNNMENLKIWYSTMEWYELSEDEARELINTYCDELSNADKTDFYQSLNFFEIDGLFENYESKLLVPVTFVKTREIISEYRHYANSY